VLHAVHRRRYVTTLMFRNFILTHSQWSLEFWLSNGLPLDQTKQMQPPTNRLLPPMLRTHKWHSPPVAPCPKLSTPTRRNQDKHRGPGWTFLLCLGISTPIPRHQDEMTISSSLDLQVWVRPPIIKPEEPEGNTRLKRLPPHYRYRRD
jgi:hypothetical protein